MEDVVAKTHKGYLWLLLYGLMGVLLWACAWWLRASAGCPVRGDCYRPEWAAWSWLESAQVVWWVLMPLILLRAARLVLPSR